MTTDDIFVPVNGGRISAEIVDQIVPLILHGTLPLGERLPSERELAEAFGVSRVSVRDALRVLEVMGLVEIKVGARGGAFVSAPSTSAVSKGVSNLLRLRRFPPDEIAEARVMLESAILELALTRITEQEIAALRELCDRSRAYLEQGEYDTSLSVEFHSKLARCAHNSAITLLAESFAGPLSMAAVRAREQPADAQRRTVQEHEALLEALEDGDAGRAMTVLTEHLRRGQLPREPAAS